jgi:excisionase family DNA binding protein
MQRAFDPGQIARMLGVGRSLVTKWIDTGKLPGYLVPYTKRRKVRYKDLEAFCKEHGLGHLFDPMRPLGKYLKRKTVLLCGVDPSLVRRLEPILDAVQTTAVIVADCFDVASLAIHKKVLGVAVDMALGRETAMEVGRSLSHIRNETNRVALVYGNEPRGAVEKVFNVVVSYPFKPEELAEMLTLTRRGPKYDTRDRERAEGEM